MTDEERMTALSRRVEASYGTEAARRKYRARASQGLRVWEDTVVGRAFPATGTVAVIGCGGGRELIALGERGYTVCGLDISMPLLRDANACAPVSRSPAPLVGMDGANLPLADRSVDALTLWSQLLGNVPGAGGRRALLGEAHRVLRPGGTLSFSVHDRERTLPLLDGDTVLSWDEPEPGDLLMHEEEEGTTRYWHYFSRDEVITLCRDAGFSEPEVCHTSDLGERWGNVLVAVATR